MSETTNNVKGRREFLKDTARLAPPQPWREWPFRTSMRPRTIPFGWP